MVSAIAHKVKETGGAVTLVYMREIMDAVSIPSNSRIDHFQATP
jgi:hypothetical protein